ncbi:hypothetical protein Ae356Ps1_1718 [Pseudonocardia sp. Ae356_Ps1]|nr:hypothetical protein Ae150APs1_0134 [Pseudonocardia sp. Ae150A_Ps1]OLL91821.1 hypothetical protein Ae356Ps1_1718 [Pseudonocardia sp. Ae356_Ps1]
MGSHESPGHRPGAFVVRGRAGPGDGGRMVMQVAIPSGTRIR